MNPIAFPTSPTVGSAKPVEGGRWAALDGLRGIAVLAVIGLHSYRIFPGGHVGVDLFFVLSGFLITSLLIRERQTFGSISLLRFYLRRALRLLPPLLAVLAIVWLGVRDYGTREELKSLNKDIVSILLYVYNWWTQLSTAPHHGILAHLWSLSVEEQFYLVWPAVLTVLLACGVRLRWLMVLALLGIIAPSVLLLATQRIALPDWARFLGQFPTNQRAYDLPIGCFLALLASSGVRPVRPAQRRVLQVAGVAAFGVLLLHILRVSASGNYMKYAGFELCALCGAVVIASLHWAPAPPLKRLLEWKQLVWVGRISYGAYLWNIPLQSAVYWLVGGRHPITVTVLTWIGTLAAGALSYNYVEAPFLRLKHKLERRTTPVVAAPTRRRAA